MGVNSPSASSYRSTVSSRPKSRSPTRSATRTRAAVIASDTTSPVIASALPRSPFRAIWTSATTAKTTPSGGRHNSPTSSDASAKPFSAGSAEACCAGGGSQ